MARRSPWRQSIECAVGYTYLAGTLVSSSYYVGIAVPYLSNDVWWPAFQTSDAAAFLATLFNTHLATTSALTNVPLVQVGLSFPATNMPLYPAYARVVQFERQSLANSIAELQSLAPNDLWYMPVQYCWLDFDKTWSVAHTAARQTRCWTRYHDNGAVYMESILRNVIWSKLMAQHAASIETVVGSVPVTTANGRTWWASLQQHNGLPAIPSEVAYWQAKGLTHYTIQWQNAIQPSFVETIGLESATGVYTLGIKRLPRVSSVDAWTTWVCSFGIWNDVRLADALNVSFVDLTQPNSNYSDAYSWYISPSVVATLTQARVGPYLSIDLRYVPLPGPLKATYETYQTWMVLPPNDQYWESFDAVTLDPVPMTWQFPPERRIVYYGGSPLCVAATPQPFVQLSFGYTDSCMSQSPFQIVLDPVRLHFAVAAAAPSVFDGAAFCSLCNTTAADCAAWVRSILPGVVAAPPPATTTAWTELIAATVTAVHDIQFVQFASQVDANDTATTLMLLDTPLVTPAPDMWNVVGWVVLFDWAAGLREVVALEGDVAVLTLVSAAYDVVPHDVLASDIPSSMVVYVQSILAFSTVVMGVAATFVVAYSLHRQLTDAGMNLLRFNRTAGIVWIGRVALIVRGFSAAAILSTARLELTTVAALSQLVVAPRSFLNTCIYAGESLWLGYILHDYLLIVPHLAKYVAPCASALSWFVLVVVGLTAPIQPVASIDRQCTGRLVGPTVCRSGSLRVGCLDRVWLIVGVHCISVSMAVLASKLICRRALPLLERTSLHLTAAFNAFVDVTLFQDTYNDDLPLLQVDAIACVLTGLLPYYWSQTSYLMDMKLWISVHVKTHNHCVQLDQPYFDRPAILRSRSLPTVAATRRPLPTLMSQQSLQLKMLQINVSARALPHKLGPAFVEIKSNSSETILAFLGGVVYMLGTVLGGVFFVVGASPALANDFLWPAFDVAGTPETLVNWFNHNLLLTSSLSTTTLLHLDWTKVNETDMSATSSLLYASKVQWEDMTKFVPTIDGLRKMNGCDVPWIYSSYCWLDFGQKWAIANSDARQDRCLATRTANAAMYLEPILRNVNWKEWSGCWGQAFEIGFGNELATTATGQVWLNSIRQQYLTESQEAAYWLTQGVTHYTTQWQNFKTIGLTETISITTALKASYELTLKQTNTLVKSEGTSKKLYWGLASDLWAISTNTSGIGGSSLLRMSPHFAFQNTTLANILAWNGTFDALSPSHALVAATLGPFGSIDAHHVVVPLSLVTYFRQVDAAIQAYLTRPDADVHGFDRLLPGAAWQLFPSWTTALASSFRSGNILCTSWYTTNDGSNTSIKSSFASDGDCDAATLDVIDLSRVQLVFGLLAWQVRYPTLTLDPTPTCIASNAGCCDVLTNSIAWLYATNNVGTATTSAIDPTLVSHIAQDVAAVALVQFVDDATSSSLQLVSLRLLSTPTPHGELMSWLYLFEWVTGTREVVSFEGDVGALTVLSAAATPTTVSLDRYTTPANLALYARAVLAYVSIVLVVVLALTVAAMCASYGYVEASNLYLFNRVAGIAYVGRPLLLIRSLVAISLLSSAPLSLVRVGPLTQLQPSPMRFPDVVQIALRAIETSWLVYVVQDLATLWSHDEAYVYASKASLMLSFVTAILSIAAPVTPAVTLVRTCSPAAIDLMLVCHSGTVAVGNFSRVLHLVGLAALSIGGCYALQVCRPGTRVPKVTSSLYLSSSANHFFRRKAKWSFEHVHHVDRASGVMTGLLVVSHGRSFYVLDVKTWRTYVLPKLVLDIDSAHPLPARFVKAIPLLH
ncbi:Aste57867_18636 [Aphanomyces stellatus]|uniref:Aste57867_18636 protein n=1 Tax=Aphanomyces stellatus TaxID=120398 RepID=A0A485LEF9_9STRA|nr:hypothetical protein As57867_018574 [Aphanomyces stellatus]VFT95371.1 Aste57867_18636 [Aphanomyces stellatus]